MSDTKVKPFYQDIDGLRLPGIILPDVYFSGLQYKPLPDDLFIVTFPKCGTTWTQQIVLLILNRGQPVAEITEFHRKTPFLEMLGQEGIDRMPRPGTIKVHLPYHLTPIAPEAKYLYVVRNPKDTLVSFYHHTASPIYKYQEGEFNDYFEIFLNGENDWGDYFDHVLGWYEHRDYPNVLFVTYEELKGEPEATIKKIAKFMGDQYLQWVEDEDVMKNVVKYSSVEYMKASINDSLDFLVENVKNDAVIEDELPKGLRHMVKCILEFGKENDKKFRLVRKGIVGDWRNNFTEDQNNRMNARIEAKLKGTDVYNYWKSIDCI